VDRLFEREQRVQQFEAMLAVRRNRLMSTLLTLVIGIFIGWNLPQPAWAKALQDKVVGAIQNFTRG
jgi:hypothetical protein